MRAGVSTTAIALAGCAQLLPWIVQNGPAIDAGIVDATQILGTIGKFIDAYFESHPDPALQAKVLDGFAKAEGALSALAQLVAGGVDVAQKDVQAALQAFATAWADLMSLVGPLGVQINGPGAKIGRDGLTIHEPAILKSVRQ
jgi:hypothetical protein